MFSLNRKFIFFLVLGLSIAILTNGQVKNNNGTNRVSNSMESEYTDLRADSNTSIEVNKSEDNLLYYEQEDIINKNKIDNNNSFDDDNNNLDTYDDDDVKKLSNISDFNEKINQIEFNKTNDGDDVNNMKTVNTDDHKGTKEFKNDYFYAYDEDEDEDEDSDSLDENDQNNENVINITSKYIHEPLSILYSMYDDIIEDEKDAHFSNNSDDVEINDDDNTLSEIFEYIPEEDILDENGIDILDEDIFKRYVNIEEIKQNYSIETNQKYDISMNNQNENNEGIIENLQNISFIKNDQTIETAVNKEINNIQLTLDSYINISSPNYPNPYPAGEEIEWHLSGKGRGIETVIHNVNLNGNIGDHLIIKPGKSTSTISNNNAYEIIFTWHLNEERHYKFFDIDELVIQFKSAERNNEQIENSGFLVSAKLIDDLETPPEVIDNILEVEENYTIFMSGLTPVQFLQVAQDFLMILADMANDYITENDIDSGYLSMKEVVQYNTVTSCKLAWPASETCIAITFGIPIHYETASNEADYPDYELSQTNLAKMWDQYHAIQPYAARISQLGLESYRPPNDRVVVGLWLATAGVVVMCIVVLIYAAWRWRLLDDYAEMRRASKAASLGSKRNTDISLYPTPHQDLPPIFGGNLNYLRFSDLNDDKEEDRHDGPGYTNQSFMKDGDLFDFDSDEEVVMSLPDDIEPKGQRGLKLDAGNRYDVDA